ncbi:hypothetical protein SAMN05216262_101101 [Colwellia chukchiensis]|uniref:Uncharacterized protein n=1 Tax=Colwellia chukchiensis TaxID=641665 RepID=A0A1H7GAR4_9GAMM|nr:hypothetical protein SAMN05216262_101101 [Colwellia chukchiensis]
MSKRDMKKPVLSLKEKRKLKKAASSADIVKTRKKK